MNDDWKPVSEDDPANVRGRGERTEASVREDFYEAWGTDDAGEWELGQMNWLEDVS